MRNRTLIGSLMMVLLLAGCGGGGGGGDNGGSSSSPGAGGGGSTPNSSSPVADAGSQQNVLTGAKVRLDGSASRDAQGDRLTYEWSFDTRPSGSSAKLQNANSVAPLFTTDVAGRYVIRLVASDGNSFSAPDTVVVVASTPPANSVPVADAGPDQSVTTSSAVQLDGSGSRDADNNAALTYNWQFVSRAPGSTATLAGSDTPAPTFTADAGGKYVVRLVVSDGQANSAPAQVTIQAATANAAPNADAGGDRSVGVGDTVNLDSSASTDANGDALSYSWQLISIPQGSGAELNGPGTATPSFVADATGSYVAQVTATDDSGASDSDRVVITAGANVALRVDLNNDGSFEAVDLPYDRTFPQTVTHAPDNGFVLGQFKVTAIGGPITLNLSLDLNKENDASGNYALAFDGFQQYDPNGNAAQTGQFTLPEDETVTLSLRIRVPSNSRAAATYGVEIPETGDSFEASYEVQSDDN